MRASCQWIASVDRRSIGRSVRRSSRARDWRRRAPAVRVSSGSRDETAGPRVRKVFIDGGPRACGKRRRDARGNRVARDPGGRVARGGNCRPRAASHHRHGRRWRELEDRLPPGAAGLGQRSSRQAEEGDLHRRRPVLRQRRDGERRVRVRGGRLRQQHLRPEPLHARRGRLRHRRARAGQRRSQVRHRVPGAAIPHQQLRVPHHPGHGRRVHHDDQGARRARRSPPRRRLQAGEEGDQDRHAVDLPAGQVLQGHGQAPAHLQPRAWAL